MPPRPSVFDDDDESYDGADALGFVLVCDEGQPAMPDPGSVDCRRDNAEKARSVLAALRRRDARQHDDDVAVGLPCPSFTTLATDREVDAAVISNVIFRKRPATSLAAMAEE